MKNDMQSLAVLKQRVQKLYETNPHIHVNVSISHPKVSLVNAEATITGVYNNLFMIEESSGAYKKSHSLQFADLITRRIEIVELNLDWEPTEVQRNRK